jgi:hypothetical protein
MIPALIRQLRYEDYFIERELPATARPYREFVRSVNQASSAAE